MARFSLILFVFIASLTLSLPAAAVWGWLRGAAITEFTDSDWVMLKAEARRVLDEVDDKTRVDWTNPETGNGGSMKPLTTFEVDGHTCRQMAFKQVTAKGIEGQAVYHLCQQDDSTWQFVAESELN